LRPSHTPHRYAPCVIAKIATIFANYASSGRSRSIHLNLANLSKCDNTLVFLKVARGNAVKNTAGF
jgi:hypothetical protein